MEGIWGSVPVCAALLLAGASCAKVRAVGGLRVWTLGALEALGALLVLTLPAAAGGALIAIVFGTFTAVHLRAYRQQAPGCNCFGAELSDRTAPGRATVLTAVVALAGVAVALAATGTPVRAAADAGVAGIASIAVGVVFAWLWYRAFTARPAHSAADTAPAQATRRPSEVLVGTAARLLETRTSRRGAMQRIALSGSALAVAPLRYLLYPGTAMAVIRRDPDSCTHGLCLDGYTEFCCQIMPGGVNACPEHTFPGGWWMCTDYAGRRLCHDAGVRYYVDCNALPGTTFPGGCHCAHDSCDQRRVACNIFRYGQCNTQVRGITAVVCRMVLCENPSRVSKLHCSSSLAIDNAVCDQDAPCLEPRARELAGAGGA
jgi:hypothetical protein